MKKLISFIFVLFLIGCSKNDYVTCNVEVDNDIQNYTMTGTYRIYYDNNYVTKIEKEEKYISPDKNVIDYFDESKNLEYYNLNDLYNGFQYKIDSNDTSIDIALKIDMDLVNIKEMVRDQYIEKDYVISNKLTTSGLIKFYESKGAICNNK